VGMFVEEAGQFDGKAVLDIGSGRLNVDEV